ncbi:hypothetical protein [Terrisporobacter muris]|uniref:Lipoprotein n=1 Tax=Terrisporobacter muris TaxID=2963284 RepID=A0A9X2MB78_9FIRM|nr:hypothetical protein [Terrisporobacter muris]MCR1822642.1 hypothetical protein [Terrisporobacter muris]
MKKQLKTLGMGLVLGTTLMTMVGCSSTESGTSNITSREDEVNAMLTEVVSSLGKEIDFGEAYLNKYMQEMSEEEYVVTMTNEINGVVREELFINENNPIDVKESEINDDSLNLLIEAEILSDMQHLEDKQIKNDINNVYEETLDEFAVDGDEGITLDEARQILEDYVAENYPEDYYSEPSGDNGSVRRVNVYDSEGNYIESVEFEYLTEEITTKKYR